MRTNWNLWTAGIVPAIVLSLAVAGGCAKSGDDGVAVTPTGGHDHGDHDHADHDHEGGEEHDHEHGEAHASTGHTHGAWWCDEHGVPEKVCALCDSKLAAEFQRKGDWCAEHNRPDSQCFVCHPEYESRFAAQYEAKYGKQPPKPQG